ncbi:hypothetical protein H9P43_004808 [Blastocladiella emersonii ATCC 22665]|nr:hypothetical protein H9P43_004808 [Blastocladiella emersonii ATCC 22665]
MTISPGEVNAFFSVEHWSMLDYFRLVSYFAPFTEHALLQSIVSRLGMVYKLLKNRPADTLPKDHAFDLLLRRLVPVLRDLVQIATSQAVTHPNGNMGNDTTALVPRALFDVEDFAAKVNRDLEWDWTTEIRYSQPQYRSLHRVLVDVKHLPWALTSAGDDWTKLAGALEALAQSTHAWVPQGASALRDLVSAAAVWYGDGKCDLCDVGAAPGILFEFTPTRPFPLTAWRPNAPMTAGDRAPVLPPRGAVVAGAVGGRTLYFARTTAGDPAVVAALGSADTVVLPLVSSSISSSPPLNFNWLVHAATATASTVDKPAHHILCWVDWDLGSLPPPSAAQISSRSSRSSGIAVFARYHEGTNVFPGVVQVRGGDDECMHFTSKSLDADGRIVIMSTNGSAKPDVLLPHDIKIDLLLPARDSIQCNKDLRWIRPRQLAGSIWQPVPLLGTPHRPGFLAWCLGTDGAFHIGSAFGADEDDGDGDDATLDEAYYFVGDAASSAAAARLVPTRQFLVLCCATKSPPLYWVSSSTLANGQQLDDCSAARVLVQLSLSHGKSAAVGRRFFDAASDVDSPLAPLGHTLSVPLHARDLAAVSSSTNETDSDVVDLLYYVPVAQSSHVRALTAMDAASAQGRTAVLEWCHSSGIKVVHSAAAMDEASGSGHVAVLDWWLAHADELDIKYSVRAMDLASEHGHVHVLDWWFAHFPPGELKFTKDALRFASKNGHLAVLDWWYSHRDSLALTYNNRTIDAASTEGRVAVLDWWLARRRELKPEYSNYAINEASIRGCIASLDWWFAHRGALRPRYSTAALDEACTRGIARSVEWWFAHRDKLPLKYTAFAMDNASRRGHVAVLEIWLKHRDAVELKYSQQAMNDAAARGHVNLLEWWRASGLPLKFSPAGMQETRVNAVREWYAQHEAELLARRVDTE